MKTNKILNSIGLIALIISIISCVEDNSFTIPDVTITEPTISTDLTIATIQSNLIQEYNGSGELSHTFYMNEENPTYVTGYVASNDAAGNFYKTLIVQDKIENPSAGIKILVNESSLGQTYAIGQKIYIKLDGLTVRYDDGEDDLYTSPENNVAGVYTLGMLNNGILDNIPSALYRSYIIKSAEIATLIPASITIGDLSERHINTLITLETVQFSKNELGKTFAGEPTDEYQGLRSIFECETEATISLETSTFASFKSNSLSAGSGSITAIFTKNYSADSFVLIVNTPGDIDLSGDERCDPPVLDCISDSVGGNTILFEEDFNTTSSFDDLTAVGWLNLNINGGDTIFELGSFSGSTYMEVSGYNSGEDPLEIWLITPAINLDTTTNESISFKTKTGYNNGPALSVWISNNFDGNTITTATWQRLGGEIANGPTNSYQYDSTASGSINISCLTGDVYVAFKYLGRDSGITTTFQIDDIKVSGE